MRPLSLLHVLRANAVVFLYTVGSAPQAPLRCFPSEPPPALSLCSAQLVSSRSHTTPQLPINVFSILLLYGVTTMALPEVLHTQCASAETSESTTHPPHYISAL